MASSKVSIENHMIEGKSEIRISTILVVRHDTWNGQIKGYRVLHVAFPPTYSPPSNPPAAQLNTVIGNSIIHVSRCHHLIRRTFSLTPLVLTLHWHGHQLKIEIDQSLCSPGTTTALNSLQPFTNYSIQVTFHSKHATSTTIDSVQRKHPAPRNLLQMCRAADC